MTSKPSGKENVGAASTRFGFTHSTKGKTKGAPTATVASKNPSVTVPLQEKDGPSADTDPYNLKKMAEEAMPDVTEQYNEIRKKLRAANKVKDIKQKMVKHDELLPMMKELLNTIRMQRYEFLPQAEQKQTDMGNSLKELETMHASAAEIPELEMRQKELQEQVSGFESQKEAAVSASKQNAAIIQDTIASSQLKDTELSQLHADISSTLEQIEKTRALFRDETTKLSDALAAQNEDKVQLEAEESKLHSCWQEKQDGFHTLQSSHKQENARNAKALEQEQDDRDKASDRRTAACAEVARREAHAALIEKQQVETKAELQQMRKATVVHKERADRHSARLIGVNKEFFTLNESTAKLEATVQSKTAEAATLRVEKDELVKQAAQADQQLRPLKQRKLALESDVGKQRELNVELNAQMQSSMEGLATADASAADEKARMDTALAARADLESKMSEVQKQHKVTTAANASLQAHNKTLTETVGNLQGQHAQESAEMQKVVSKSSSVESELETLRSHSNMSATQQADALTACDQRCAELRAKKEKLLRESTITDEDMKKLQATADANKKVLANMGADADAAAERRREQWMAISNLKGNVRTICRVCPNAASVQSGSVTCGPSSTGIDDTVTVLPPQASADPAEGQTFVFDKVLPVQASMKETFNHLRDMVDHAVSGEQVCIFACGQSGSGKSSMLGDENSGENTLVRFALEQFLDATTRDDEWNYSSAASLAVINGDGVVDPLSKSPAAPVETPVDVDGTVSLKNLTSVPAYDRSAFMMKITGAAAETAADTAHKVLTITTHAENAKDTTIAARTGCLRFIELAGTEHLDELVGTSDRHLQAAHSSLTELKQIFEAIINKQRPNFDAGILTQLSRPFLSTSGGKAVMLIHVPEHQTQSSYHESVRALRLATQVASCEIGPLNKYPSKRTAGHNGGRAKRSRS